MPFLGGGARVGVPPLVEALGEGGHIGGPADPLAARAWREVAYAELSAHGWRYYAIDDVSYERRIVLIGGPFMTALTAILSSCTNRHNEAERIAEPQWRPLGRLTVVVT